MWEIEYTDEFEKWWDSLTTIEQEELTASIGLLEQIGPNLGRPHCDTINDSNHKNMKELRTQVKGSPLRTFFAFDPRRCAILLIGGDKTGETRFYEKMIPLADKLFTQHLKDLKDEKEI